METQDVGKHPNAASASFNNIIKVTLFTHEKTHNCKRL